PIEKRHRSSSPPASASGVASSTVSSPSFAPAEREEANARTSSNPRWASSSRTTEPTAPVAPTTPILGMLPLRLRRVELERPVQDRDRRLDLVAADVTRDLDWPRGDHLRLDPGLREGLRCLRGHA